MHGRLLGARIPLASDPDVMLGRFAKENLALQADLAAARASIPTDEQRAAYEAVREAAQEVADHFGVDPDDALMWYGAENECGGIDPSGIDALRDLRDALRPFTFAEVPRLKRRGQ